MQNNKNLHSKMFNRQVPDLINVTEKNVSLICILVQYFSSFSIVIVYGQYSPFIVVIVWGRRGTLSHVSAFYFFRSIFFFSYFFLIDTLYIFINHSGTFFYYKECYYGENTFYLFLHRMAQFATPPLQYK